MAVEVITETGDRIPLTGDLVNGGAAAEAYVADQRDALGLPAVPLKAADVAAFLAANPDRIERATERRRKAAEPPKAPELPPVDGEGAEEIL